MDSRVKDYTFESLLKELKIRFRESGNGSIIFTEPDSNVIELMPDNLRSIIVESPKTHYFSDLRTEPLIVELINWITVCVIAYTLDPQRVKENLNADYFSSIFEFANLKNANEIYEALNHYDYVFKMITLINNKPYASEYFSISFRLVRLSQGFLLNLLKNQSNYLAQEKKQARCNIFFEIIYKFFKISFFSLNVNKKENNKIVEDFIKTGYSSFMSAFLPMLEIDEILPTSCVIWINKILLLFEDNFKILVIAAMNSYKEQLKAGIEKKNVLLEALKKVTKKSTGNSIEGIEPIKLESLALEKILEESGVSFQFQKACAAGVMPETKTLVSYLAEEIPTTELDETFTEELKSGLTYHPATLFQSLPEPMLNSLIEWIIFNILSENIALDFALQFVRSSESAFIDAINKAWGYTGETPIFTESYLFLVKIVNTLYYNPELDVLVYFSEAAEKMSDVKNLELLSKLFKKECEKRKAAGNLENSLHQSHVLNIIINSISKTIRCPQGKEEAKVFNTQVKQSLKTLPVLADMLCFAFDNISDTEKLSEMILQKSDENSFLSLFCHKLYTFVAFVCIEQNKIFNEPVVTKENLEYFLSQLLKIWNTFLTKANSNFANAIMSTISPYGELFIHVYVKILMIEPVGLDDQITILPQFYQAVLAAIKTHPDIEKVLTTEYYGRNIIYDLAMFISNSNYPSPLAFWEDSIRLIKNREALQNTLSRKVISEESVYSIIGNFARGFINKVQTKALSQSPDEYESLDQYIRIWENVLEEIDNPIVRQELLLAKFLQRTSSFKSIRMNALSCLSTALALAEDSRTLAMMVMVWKNTVAYLDKSDYEQVLLSPAEYKSEIKVLVINNLFYALYNASITYKDDEIAKEIIDTLEEAVFYAKLWREALLEPTAGEDIFNLVSHVVSNNLEEDKQNIQLDCMWIKLWVKLEEVEQNREAIQELFHQLLKSYILKVEANKEINEYYQFFQTLFDSLSDQARKNLINQKSEHFAGEKIVFGKLADCSNSIADVFLSNMNLYPLLLRYEREEGEKRLNQLFDKKDKQGKRDIEALTFRLGYHAKIFSIQLDLDDAVTGCTIELNTRSSFRNEKNQFVWILETRNRRFQELVKYLKNSKIVENKKGSNKISYEIKELGKGISQLTLRGSLENDYLRQLWMQSSFLELFSKSQKGPVDVVVPKYASASQSSVVLDEEAKNKWKTYLLKALGNAQEVDAIWESDNSLTISFMHDPTKPMHLNFGDGQKLYLMSESNNIKKQLLKLLKKLAKYANYTAKENTIIVRCFNILPDDMIKVINEHIRGLDFEFIEEPEKLSPLEGNEVLKLYDTPKKSIKEQEVQPLHIQTVLSMLCELLGNPIFNDSSKVIIDTSHKKSITLTCNLAGAPSLNVKRDRPYHTLNLLLQLCFVMNRCSEGSIKLFRYQKELSTKIEAVEDTIAICKQRYPGELDAVIYKEPFSDFLKLVNDITKLREEILERAMQVEDKFVVMSKAFPSASFFYPRFKLPEEPPRMEAQSRSRELAKDLVRVLIEITEDMPIKSLLDYHLDYLLSRIVPPTQSSTYGGDPASFFACLLHTQRFTDLIQLNLLVPREKHKALFEFLNRLRNTIRHQSVQSWESFYALIFPLVESMKKLINCDKEEIIKLYSIFLENKAIHLNQEQGSQAEKILLLLEDNIAGCIEELSREHQISEGKWITTDFDEGKLAAYQDAIDELFEKNGHRENLLHRDAILWLASSISEMDKRTSEAYNTVYREIGHNFDTEFDKLASRLVEAINPEYSAKNCNK